MVLENTLESPLDSKIKPVNPKGNQSWIFIGRTDAENEAPILWPPDAKNWLTGKDPDAGKDWRQEEKGTTEDEMVGWHHWLDGHESEQALGVGDGQGSLACYSPWGCKELDMTEWLNWTELKANIPVWHEEPFFSLYTLNLFSLKVLFTYHLLLPENCAAILYLRMKSIIASSFFFLHISPPLCFIFIISILQCLIPNWNSQFVCRAGDQWPLRNFFILNDMCNRPKMTPSNMSSF